MSTLSRVVGDPTVIPGNPGTPDIPAQDAYTTTDYVKDPHWEVVSATPPNVSLRYVYWRAVLVEHPAVPGVPGDPGTPDREITQPPPGWGATAFSKESILDGRFVFKVVAPTPGVTVGLTRSPRSPLFFEPTGGYATDEGPLPGLYFEGNYVWLATARLTQPPGDPITSFFKEDLFTIERRRGRVRYLQNGYLMADVADFYPRTDRLWASASLYDAGSKVTDAQFLPLLPDDGAAMTMHAIEIDAGDPRDLYVDRPLPKLRMVAGDVIPVDDPAIAPLPSIYLDAPLPRLVMQAGDVIRGDGADMVLRPLTLTALNGVPEPTAGARDGAAMRLRPITLAARATGIAVPPPDPTDEPPPVVPLLVEMPMAARVTIAHSISDAGDAALMPIALRLDLPMVASEVAPTATMPIALAADIRFLITEMGDAVMPIALTVDIPIVLVGADIDVYAVNLATSGSTRYQGFPFTSFARIGNRYFGAGNLGVCELGGDTDAGEPIDVVVDLGDKDFGTPQRKTLVEAWMALASPRPMVLELRAEGARFVYRTEGANLHLQERRVKFGKGRALQTTFITPILRNEDGADFELDAIQFAVQVLSRKS